MLTKELLGEWEQIYGCDACACVCCELKKFSGSDEIKRNCLPLELTDFFFPYAPLYRDQKILPRYKTTLFYVTPFFLCGINGGCERVLCEYSIL